MLGSSAAAAPRPAPNPAGNAGPTRRFSVGPQLYGDDFSSSGLSHWKSELEAGGTVASGGGRLTIDVPRGATVWFRPELQGPVEIEYQATEIQRGGPHDRVSDLNCFWMAQDPAHPDKLLETRRSGKFSDYDTLTAYYVGQGGNGNTTTRFRRYVGSVGDRPLLPQNDLRGPAFLLQPNITQTIRLVACGGLIQYYRDGHLIFQMQDPSPYTRGWFGLRTTQNHMEVRHFRVYRLLPRREKPPN